MSRLKKIAEYTICVLSLFILIQGCGIQQVSKEMPVINEIAKNARFKINLPEDHTTGQLWQLKQNFDKTIVEELNAVWHGNEKGIDFNFKALSVGQVTLNLVLRKYTDTSNVKSFIVKIGEN